MHQSSENRGEGGRAVSWPKIMAIMNHWTVGAVATRG